jgi:hypothetical protein
MSCLAAPCVLSLLWVLGAQQRAREMQPLAHRAEKVAHAHKSLSEQAHFVPGSASTCTVPGPAVHRTVTFINTPAALYLTFSKKGRALCQRMQAWPCRTVSLALASCQESLWSWAPMAQAYKPGKLRSGGSKSEDSPGNNL